MPLVSVITPAYNAEKHIADAIASVRAQTLEDWELIIIDDGSTDDTASIVNSVGDSRIQLIQQKNAGVSSARNAGLEVAKGKYLTFLDADDCLPTDALAARARFLAENPDVDIVNGAIQITSSGHLLRNYHPDLQKGLLSKRLARLEEGVFMGPFYMLRRNKIGAHRFPMGVSHCEDMIFLLTLAHSMQLCYGAVSEKIYEYRVTSGSAMSNLDGIERGYLNLIKATGELQEIDHATRIYQYKRIRRILLRSWLRRLRPIRALHSLIRTRLVFSMANR